MCACRLAEKIRLARVNKQRQDQLTEKAALQTQQREYDEAFNAHVTQSEAAAEARAVAEETRRREQNVKARQVLEEQMAERTDALKLAELEAQRERAMVDEVVRRILEEDADEATLKRHKQEETKDYIARFLAEQDEARRRKVEADLQEDNKIKVGLRFGAWVWMWAWYG